MTGKRQRRRKLFIFQKFRGYTNVELQNGETLLTAEAMTSLLTALRQVRQKLETSGEWSRIKDKKRNRATFATRCYKKTCSSALRNFLHLAPLADVMKVATSWNQDLSDQRSFQEIRNILTREMEADLNIAVHCEREFLKCYYAHFDQSE